MPQQMQTGDSSLFMRCWCVTWVCQILRWVMDVSCFLVMFSGKGQGKVVLLISCNLVNIFICLFSHRSYVSLVMILLTSWYEKFRVVWGLSDRCLFSFTLNLHISFALDFLEDLLGDFLSEFTERLFEFELLARQERSEVLIEVSYNFRNSLDF